MGFSVGIGLTNECNLKCPHCYLPDSVVERLTLEDVRRVCESIPPRSMNLGVGENGLHTHYEAILEYLWTRGIARDYDGLVLGNAFTTSFGEIRNGERYQRFRTQFETDAPPDPCRGCGLLWSL